MQQLIIKNINIFSLSKLLLIIKIITHYKKYFLFFYNHTDIILTTQYKKYILYKLIIKSTKI